MTPQNINHHATKDMMDSDGDKNLNSCVQKTDYKND